MKQFRHVNLYYAKTMNIQVVNVTIDAILTENKIDYSTLRHPKQETPSGRIMNHEFVPILNASFYLPTTILVYFCND